MGTKDGEDAEEVCVLSDSTEEGSSSLSNAEEESDGATSNELGAKSYDTSPEHHLEDTSIGEIET